MQPLDAKTLEQYLQVHRQYFQSGNTTSLVSRMQALEILKKSIQQYEEQILEALKKDLGKSQFEAYTTEVGYTLSSIGHAMKSLKSWVKPIRVKTPVYLLPAKEKIYSEPYGTVLIIGPYNYPFQLVIEPLIGAIAAGNCAIIKPSELTPNVSHVIFEMLSSTFDEAFVRVIEGGVETNKCLTEGDVDYIFFTGSVQVGKKIMKAAAEHLTPITLELGGKSPVIVDETANIKVAASKIIWGKTVNAGQTCIAPDYVYVHKSKKEQLVEEMIKCIHAFYGENCAISEDFGRIVNERHFERISNLIAEDRQCIVHGGNVNKEALYIEPTLIEVENWEAATMGEEIFGPVLPIMTYENLEEVKEAIRARPKPLALYLFTEDKGVERKIIQDISAGGISVNDTIMHIVNPYLPFGGVGHAGMGAYHGKYSFDTFSHQKSVSAKGTKISMDLMLPPYNNKKLAFIKKVFK